MLLYTHIIIGRSVLRRSTRQSRIPQLRTSLLHRSILRSVVSLWRFVGGLSPYWSIERSCDAPLASFGESRTVSRRWGAEPPWFIEHRCAVGGRYPPAFCILRMSRLPVWWRWRVLYFAQAVLQNLRFYHDMNIGWRSHV